MTKRLQIGDLDAIFEARFGNTQVAGTPGDVSSGTFSKSSPQSPDKTPGTASLGSKETRAASSGMPDQSPKAVAPARRALATSAATRCPALSSVPGEAHGITPGEAHSRMPEEAHKGAHNEAHARMPVEAHIEAYSKAHNAPPGDVAPDTPTGDMALFGDLRREKLQRVAFRLPEGQVRFLDSLAKSTGATRVDIMKAMISHFEKRMSGACGDGSRH